MSHGKPMLNSIEFLGDTMSPNDSCKYLGVILDKKLNFKEFVDTISKKLSKFCGLMYRIRHYHSRNILLRFYFSFAQSVIQYGILVYGCTNKTNLHPTYQAQKRIVRAIFVMKNWDSVSGHFRKFNLLTVYELHIQSLLRQYFEERTGNSPSFVFKAELPEQHIMKIRRAKLNCLMPKLTRTLYMRNSLEIRLLKIHNWLMTKNLMPESLNSLNLRQKLAEFTQLYIADNEVLHQLFFLVTSGTLWFRFRTIKGFPGRLLEESDTTHQMSLLDVQTFRFNYFICCVISTIQLN